MQQVIGIVAEPMLVPAGEEGVLDAAREARLLVVGLSERWPSEGIGPARLAVAGGAGVPTLFVRRGLRPSGVAPRGDAHALHLDARRRAASRLAELLEPSMTGVGQGCVHRPVIGEILDLEARRDSANAR